MDGDWIVWGVALAVVIDMVMIVVAWLYLVDTRARSFQADAGHSVCDSWADDDEVAFKSASNDRYSHDLLTNPATGLPMLDGVWMDVAGNPYGADLHVRFNHECGDFGSNSFDSRFETFGTSDTGSGFDSFGSDCFSSGLGGMHDW